MLHRRPSMFRQRFHRSHDYDDYDSENRPPSYQPPTSQNHYSERTEMTNSSFPPRKSFIDTIVTRNDEYWQSRVTLKLDVPFTDHSHIIGRGGKNTQAVMKQTACHIHFPDSNKNHDADKSNQVSIAGQLNMVEIARSRIRGLAPLSISFELKGMLPSVIVDELVADACLEKTFGFAELNIVVRTNRSSAQPYCLVRGSAHQSSMMVEACDTLRRFFFPPETNVQYSTSLEVLPAQQTSVIGQNGRHMQWIVQKTGAVVHYPSASDCQRGASTFYIAGPINSILEARRHILGLLPVQLTFEMHRENAKTVQPDLAVLEQQLGVTLAIKPRAQGGDFGSKTVTVRAHECNLTNVYAVRLHLMNLREEGTLCADYEFMSEMRAFLQQPTAVMPPMSTVSPVISNSDRVITSQPQQIFAPPHQMLYSGYNPLVIQQHGCNIPMKTISANYVQQQALPSPLSVLMPTQQYSQPPYPLQPQQNGMSYVQSQSQSQSRPANQWLLPARNQSISRSTGLGSSVSSERSSPRETDSDRSAEERQSAVVTVAGEDEPPKTPKTSAISPNPEDSPIAHSVLSGAKKINEQYGRRWRKASCTELSSDRDQMRMQATMAMTESLTPGGVRTPTDQWSGLLFSNSTPADVLTKMSSQPKYCPPHVRRRRSRCSDDENSGNAGALPSVMEDEDEDCELNGAVDDAFATSSPRSPESLVPTRRLTDFAATSYWDAAQSRCLRIDWNISDFYDPSMVLAALGLSDYQGRFRDQEIDMETFLSLDEQNLKELGVTTIGARKKLQLAIMKLNESVATSYY